MPALARSANRLVFICLKLPAHCATAYHFPRRNRRSLPDNQIGYSKIVIEDPSVPVDWWDFLNW